MSSQVNEIFPAVKQCERFQKFKIVFLGNTIAAPEIYDLSTVNVVEHLPCYNRLILKIESKSYQESCDDFSAKNRSFDYLFKRNSSCEVYNSSRSVNSIVEAGDRERVLFIGFEESWERDLWSNWLIQVSVLTNSMTVHVVCIILSMDVHGLCIGRKSC